MTRKVLLLSIVAAPFVAFVGANAATYRPTIHIDQPSRCVRFKDGGYSTGPQAASWMRPAPWWERVWHKPDDVNPDNEPVYYRTRVHVQECRRWEQSDLTFKEYLSPSRSNLKAGDSFTIPAGGSVAIPVATIVRQK